MIFPLKRNFCDKIFEVSNDFSRGACEGPKFSKGKIFEARQKSSKSFTIENFRLYGIANLLLNIILIVMFLNLTVLLEYIHTNTQ